MYAPSNIFFFIDAFFLNRNVNLYENAHHSEYYMTRDLFSFFSFLYLRADSFLLPVYDGIIENRSRAKESVGKKEKSVLFAKIVEIGVPEKG